MRIAVPYELDSVDPHAADRLSNFALLLNIYEALVDTDAEMRIRPLLAASWETPDPLTWVFHLRQGVVFHGGRPLRSADVVYSFTRLRGREGLQVRNFTRDVSQIDALDDLTVRIRTFSPSPVLLPKLRHVAIIPEGTQAETFFAHSEGTGPYEHGPFRNGEPLVLQRNPRYWGRPPVVPRVEFFMGQGSQDAMRGLVAGRYQLVQCDSREAVQYHSPRQVVLERNSLYVKYLCFDLEQEVTPHCSVRPNPFRDARVRAAIAAAIDRRKVVSRLPTAASPATQPIPRFVFGFNPNFPEEKVDRDRARALLKEAGLGGGFAVALHTRRFGREAAVSLQGDLGEVGIRVEVRSVDDGEYFDLLSRRQLSFWLTRIGCATGDASELFEDLIHSPDAAGRGSLNDGRYHNPDLDRAIERSVTLEDSEQRLRAFEKIMDVILHEHALVPLYNDRDTWVMDESLAWQPRNDSEIRVQDVTWR